MEIKLVEMHRKFPKIVSIAYYAGPNMNQLGLHFLSTPGPGKEAWGRHKVETDFGKQLRVVVCKGGARGSMG